MIETLLQYIPLPFTDNAYEYAVITEQISRELVIFSHIPTTVIALAATVFLYKNAKNLSTFYLLLLTIVFFLWGYFDLLAWTSETRTMMFGWTTLPVLGITFTFLSYWFLYTFVKGKDLPLWQKVASLLTLVPAIYAVITNTYLSDYYAHAITPIESTFVTTYVDIINTTFLAIVAIFTSISYRSAQNEKKKKQILLAGLGVFGMLFIFTMSLVISTIMHRLDALAGQADNASVYALFGMPILVAFLGYLVVKHQAFGVTMLRSVGYVIVLMILFFLSVFI